MLVLVVVFLLLLHTNSIKTSMYRLSGIKTGVSYLPFFCTSIFPKTSPYVVYN